MDALSHSEFQLSYKQCKGLVEMVPSGAMIVDAEGNIVASNALLDQILNESSDSIDGCNIQDFLPSSIKQTHSGLLSSFFQSPSTRQMGVGRKLYATTASGRDIPIEIGLNPIKIEGIDHVLATVSDITERLKGSERFEKSVKVAPHGILMVNGHGEITLVNQSLCKCFGYCEEEIVGKSIEMLLPERYRNHHIGLREGYWKSPSIRMMGKGRDLTALHADGREFPVEIGLSPLNDEDNTALVTLTDITQRKRLEMELKESNTNLEEFTYVASHDLRSPLRGISDLLTWVKEDLGEDYPETVGVNLDRISIRIERMETLIENLLSYARAGKQHASTDLIKIPDLIDETLSFVTIPEGFKVSTKIDADSFYGAKTPVETVLRNLISNAIKHHDKDTGSIHISSKHEGNMIRLSVEDDGPGIPESALNRVFRLFQTATASERNGTSGVGLSVSRRMTESHGGSISVENTGTGSVFHARWPRFIRKDTHD